MFDFDTVEIKKTHNLRKLFLALKQESQAKLDADFKRQIAPSRFTRFFFGDLGFRDVLGQHADAFVDWRYLHQAKQLHFNEGAFVAILDMVLHEFRTLYRKAAVTPTLRLR